MSYIREGIVVSTSKSSVRVKFEDAEGLVSYDLPVLCKRTKDDKQLTIPDVGELVICCFKEIGGVDGYVIGSHYNAQDIEPDDHSQSKVFHYTTKDGAVIEYDRETGALTATNIKSANITALETVNIKTPTVTIDGDLVVNGSSIFNGKAHSSGNISTDGEITATGNITSDGKILDKAGNSNNHSH